MSRRWTRHSDLSLQDDAFLNKMIEILNCETCDGAPKTMDALMPHVYIGNMENAESYQLLRRNRITHVLNCAGFKGKRSYEGSPYQGLDIEYKEIQADDHETYDISQHFSEAFRYLSRVKARRGCALVHCVQGVNRSAAICVAYLMEERGMKLLQAIRLIKRKRNVVLCNRGFLRQLLQFAKQNNKLENIHEATLDWASSYRKSSISKLPLTFNSVEKKDTCNSHMPKGNRTERRHSISDRLNHTNGIITCGRADIDNMSMDMFEEYIKRRMEKIFI